ncbi:MAG: MFS transporter [Gammaproteobacteria bacterium]|nr:MFS transporter [Gammaproteobacteria bacterium]MDE2264213.1 MFS transporter [Gammaproteobacteria bacterium]
MMEKHDLRAAISLAAVFSVRMLGLFMVYPVFAAFARHLAGATPYKIGVALGIYGLSQGVLQMPFGALSDRIGRKVMIVIGLIVFAIGSAVAASASTIDGMIVGRLLQGAGAIGSVVLALVADLTAEKNRTKAMALVGMTIGFSFLVAIVTGPAIAGWVGVAGIFWLMAALALAGIAITTLVVPAPPRRHARPEAATVPGLIGASLRNPELLRLDFGIFALHAMLTASFLVMPALLRGTLAMSSREQWLVYLPVLLVSVAVMVPAIMVAERHGRMKAVLVGSVAALAASQLMLAVGGPNPYVLLAGLVVFFSGFNIMEASLPSLVTKTAPAGSTGTATGIYSSSQFLGIFVGGVVGGWIHQAAGTTAVFLFASAVAIVWLLVAATMRHPALGYHGGRVPATARRSPER